MPVKKPSKAAAGREEIVTRYFELVSALRKGEESAVDGLMELWDPRGVFEFAGPAPLIGKFDGAMAIRTLYQNRVGAGGRNVPVEAGDGKDLHLGVVDTKVLKVSTKDGRTVAGWRTIVGTEEKLGFDESGSHEFTFAGGKIKKLRVRVAGKPKQSELSSLSLKDLTVRDIGRLSLAAWAVVA